MIHLLRAIGAGTLIAAAWSLAGCGAAGQPPALQIPNASLPSGQTKKNRCTAPCIYIANELNASINIYQEKANGDAAPAGSLSGANTELGEVWGVAFDAANNIYAANYRNASGTSSVTVYSAGSRGDVAPISQITGPPSGDTMGSPSDVAVDAAGDIYVSGIGSNSVSVYAPGANGAATPVRYISGSKTDLQEPSYLYVTAKGKLYVANFLGESISVYAPGADGNVAPIQMIAGAKTGMYRATGVAVDDRGRIYVASSQLGSRGGCCVTVYSKNANGNSAPIQSISGAQTGLTGPDGIGLDSDDNIYVTEYPPNSGTASVTVFGKGASGDVAPIRTIAGSKTGIDGPAGITVH